MLAGEIYQCMTLERDEAEELGALLRLYAAGAGLSDPSLFFDAAEILGDAMPSGAFALLQARVLDPGDPLEGADILHGARYLLIRSMPPDLGT